MRSNVWSSLRLKYHTLVVGNKEPEEVAFWNIVSDYFPLAFAAIFLLIMILLAIKYKPKKDKTEE